MFNVADKTAFCFFSKTWVVFHPTSDCTLIFVSFDHPPSTVIMMMMTMTIKLKLNGLLWQYFWFFLKQWNDSLNKKIRLRRCKSGTARCCSVVEHHSMCSILYPMRDRCRIPNRFGIVSRGWLHCDKQINAPNPWKTGTQTINVGQGVENEVIWFYQLSWQCKLATVKRFESWRVER